MNSTETEVVADAVLLRGSEHDRDLWAAIDDDHLPEAFALSERGVLDRRWHDGDPVFRLTDSALRGYQLSGFANPN